MVKSLRMDRCKAQLLNFLTWLAVVMRCMFVAGRSIQGPFLFYLLGVRAGFCQGALTEQGGDAFCDP